jgi:hypothetical protein
MGTLSRLNGRFEDYNNGRKTKEKENLMGNDEDA